MQDEPTRFVNPVVVEKPAPKLNALPEWAKNAVIYEINVRQYSESGTLSEVTADLERISDLGVDILWLMPIYPIGEKRRKGSLGSYYSVKDYKAVNPEHGTLQDLKDLVNKAHQLDMKVILDWVPNHTSWDNNWISEHPEWFTHVNDTITHPLDQNSGKSTGWTDVADLNYDNSEMRAAMIDALQFWVREVDIDGYRCDVAGYVPLDFWREANTALHSMKEIFMLAEWDNVREHFDVGFHMNYSWGYKDLIKEVAHGKRSVEDIWKFYNEQGAKYADKAVHMYFITNHDENSWNDFPAVLGEAEMALAVLTMTFDGMPLIYSGQESGLKRKVSFFDKDHFDWKDYAHTDFYRQLNSLKANNQSLYNGTYGGDMTPIADSEGLFAFKRAKNGDEVSVFLNLSDKPIALDNKSWNQGFKELMKEGVALEGDKITFAPWSYWVLEK